MSVRKTKPFNQCCAKVRVQTSFHRTQRCTNNGSTFVDNKWWCGVHDPDKKRAEKAKKEAAWEQGRTVRRQEMHGPALYRASATLMQAVKAHEENTAPDRHLTTGVVLSHARIAVEYIIDKIEGRE